MRDLEDKMERDALCPDCGQGFKVYLDRIAPQDLNTKNGKLKTECPHCGCRECRISDHV